MVFISTKRFASRLLQFHSIKFDKTHDLSRLAVELIKLYPDLDALMNEAVKRTQYAVIIRYPDAMDVDLKLESVDQALKIAARLYDEACSRIPFSSSFDFNN